MIPGLSSGIRVGGVIRFGVVGVTEPHHPLVHGDVEGTIVTEVCLDVGKSEITSRATTRELGSVHYDVGPLRSGGQDQRKLIPVPKASFQDPHIVT
eukprot:Skav234854  [mRNA]  locus=scaffold840:66452:66739:+ [translate_table: standard]